jgi:hypothetical protein
LGAGREGKCREENKKGELAIFLHSWFYFRLKIRVLGWDRTRRSRF